MLKELIRALYKIRDAILNVNGQGGGNNEYFKVNIAPVAVMLENDEIIDIETFISDILGQTDNQYFDKGYLFLYKQIPTYKDVMSCYIDRYGNSKINFASETYFEIGQYQDYYLINNNAPI